MNWESFTDTQKALTRELAGQSLEFFSRAMFRFQQGAQMGRNWHVSLICDELEKTVTGETECLILNIPPGAGKTHLASMSYPAWCYANEPWCRFLTVSYSNELVKDISTRIRDTVIDGDEFQEMWPLQVSKDSNEKSHWTLVDHKGRRTGSFKCASSGGAITGFRAGTLRSGFSGALIMDDVSKRSDMLTPKKRENSNHIWETTRTRYGSPKTPTVVIQQRLHVEDATGFKLKGMKCIEDGGWYRLWRNKNGSGKLWRQIIIPALIDDEYVARLPDKYQRRVTGMLYGCDDKGRYSYWPEKETLDTLLDIEHTSPYMFRAEYLQDPVALGGNLMPPTCWQYYNKANAPKFEWRFITGDTALKAKQTSDFTVFALWGVTNGQLYLIDYIRGRWESPQMRLKFLSFIASHNDKEQYPHDRYGTLRGAWVEDAVSGVGLIAECRNASPVPINPYKPNRLGKFASCQDTLPFLESEYSTGRVWLPEDMPETKLTDWVAEHAAFTADQSHRNDDMADNTFIAVSIGLRGVILSGSDDSVVSVGGDDEVYVF